MSSEVAGLAPSSPGWSRVRFRPRPWGGLTRLSASVCTPRGEIAATGRLDERGWEFSLQMPPGLEVDAEFSTPTELVLRRELPDGEEEFHWRPAAESLGTADERPRAPRCAKAFQS